MSPLTKVKAKPSAERERGASGFGVGIRGQYLELPLTTLRMVADKMH